MVTRQSLFHETVDDNLTQGKTDWQELAQWTPEIKKSRLLPIESQETNITELLNCLLEHDPWMRKKSVGDLFSLPFFASELFAIQMEEIEVVIRKNYKKHPGATEQEGKFSTPGQKLVMGDFNKCAHSLKSNMCITFEKPDHSLRGMELEVEALADCPECAEIQAQALESIQSSETQHSIVSAGPQTQDCANARRQEHVARTRALAKKLKEFKAQCRKDEVYFYQKHTPIAPHIQELYDNIRRMRKDMEEEGLWYYGCNAPGQQASKLTLPEWPPQSCKGASTEEFKQPMCNRCRKYCLDWTSISEDLYYVLHERCSEKPFPNGTRDKGRLNWALEDFMKCDAARKLQIEQVASMRFYTSHSFRSIILHLRNVGNDSADDPERGPHPLPAILENIVKGLVALRPGKDGTETETKILWRGLSNVELRSDFRGGTENALMSTSTKFEVALQYAVKLGQPNNILFRIVTLNNVQRGADVTWLSMFPTESEVLFPPFTFLQADPRVPVKNIKHGSTSFRVVTVTSTIGGSL